MAAEGSFLIHQAAQFWAPLAGLTAIGYVTLSGARPEQPGRIKWARVLAVVALGLLVFRFGWMVHRNIYHPREADDVAEESLGRDLAGFMPPQETMYVVGGVADVYLVCGRRAPTRYFESVLLRTPQEQQSVVTELRRELPGAVVLAPHEFSYQQDFLNLVEAQLLPGRYVEVREWEFGRYKLYLRADLAQRAFPNGLPADLEAPSQPSGGPSASNAYRQWWRHVTGSRAR
jgi:hypothetical protein